MSNSVVDADVAIGDQRLLAARHCNSSAHAHAPTLDELAFGRRHGVCNLARAAATTAAAISTARSASGHSASTSPG